jgi:hypothetical protein
LCAHCLPVGSDDDFECSGEMFVPEVCIDRAAIPNTVFSGFRFENLDGGPGILGQSKERANKKTKQNPLQGSVHDGRHCNVAIYDKQPQPVALIVARPQIARMTGSEALVAEGLQI